MTRISLVLSMLCLSFFVKAQSFNMPYSGSDTSSLCSGTLYDHGGPTGNYSNSANGYFYLDPAGGTLSITFSAFNTENCCDRLYVYDGIGIGGTLLGTYRGSGLPNGGAAITIPSGKATLRFYSDGSVTSSGFALSWLAGGGVPPVANFTVGNLNPPVNVGVNFTNTSTGAGTPTWYFGDGDTSNAQNPVHAYTAPGTYNAYLITTDCFGGDTSASQTITVMPTPVFNVSPDSLNLTVNCGDVFSASLAVNNASGGTLQFTTQDLDNNGNAIIFQERFESGLGAFTISPSASSAFSANAILGGAAGSNGALLINGYTSIFNGLSATYPAAQADEISYHIKPTNNTYHGEIGFGENTSIGYNMLLYSRVRYNFLYVYTGGGTYTYPINSNLWNHIEAKNIDWVNHTYDLYINNISVATGLLFYDQFINSLNDVYIWNSNNYSCSFDEITVSRVSPVPFNTTSNVGTVAVSNSDTINVLGSAAGMLAGTYNYFIKVNTNSTGADSAVYVPLELNVVGASAINLDKSCVNFDTTYSVVSKSDSIMIYNPGCDTLLVSSITSTNADFTLNNSSLSLAPFDSTYLHVTFNPSALGAVNDTIHLLNNSSDTAICLSAFVVGAPAIATDSSSYTIYSLGCNDSIPFNFEIINTGVSNLTWDIVSGGSGSYYDDFENGMNTSIWQSLGSMNIGSACFSNSGSNALMVEGTNRFAVTVPFNVTTNDTVKFWVAPASGACEQPDGGEYLYLQYSTNGFSWITMGTVLNYQTAGFVSFPVPLGAVSTSTQFRLAQTSYSGSNFDEYMVDDFSVGTGSGGNFQPAMGTTTSGDTVQISGYFSTIGLSSGTYVRTVKINSNDPSDSVYQFTVNIVVQGAPYAVVPASCLQFDTVMSMVTSVDSALVFNDGCEDLVITSMSTNSLDFSVLSSALTVPPGDSVYISVQFSPTTTLGVLSDTLTIVSNDTLRTVCLSGYAVGAPIASVSPDSLYASFSSCNDSITIPVTLYNTGAGDLTYSVEGSGSAANLKVVLYQYGSNYTEFQNVSFILNAMPNVTIVTSNATNAAALTADLSEADVIVFPEGGSILSSLVPVIQNFCTNGGGYVHLMSYYLSYTQIGIFPVSTVSSTFSGGSINNLMPSHPIMNGVLSSFAAQNASMQLTLTGSTANVLAKRSTSAGNDAVVFTVPYGRGNGVFVGFDFYQYSTQSRAILEQAITWSAQGRLPEYLTVTPDSGMVAVADSVVLDVKISTVGLQNGRQNSQITISTNDPQNPEIVIPITIDVNGTGQSELLSLGCVNFDSTLVGAVDIDSVLITNIGCDTLIFNAAGSSSGDFDLAFAPDTIVPGDSAVVFVNFSPSTMGTINDTLYLFSNVDTVAVCVSGKGLGAPITVVTPDTLRVRLNACNSFTIENLNIANQGQGAMAYEVELNDLYQDTSLAFFNTNGAVTNHVFTNTPSTADTIWFMTVVNGDFDNGGEIYSVTVDGTYLGNNFVHFLPVGTNDTAIFYYAGPNISTWLADNTLNVTLTNTNAVNPNFTNALDMHFVQVSIGSSGPPWLSLLSPATGNLAIGSSVNKSLLFTAGSMAPGQYTTTISVKSNDPVNPVVKVPVIFDLVNEPEISISDTCLFFPTTLLGDTTIRDFWVYNNGCSNLNLSSVISVSTSFKINPSTGIIPPGDSLLVSVLFIPKTINSFNSSVIVNNNDTTQLVCLLANSLAKVVANFNFTVQNPCTGQVLFIDNSLYTPTSYLWDFGDGNTSTLNNVTHNFAKPGTYKVLLTVTNSAGSDTTSTLITVNPLYVGFSMTNDTTLVNKTVNFYDSSIVATAWRWNFGDGNTSTLANPTHTYLNIGNYNVTLEVDDANSCTKSIVKNIHVVDDIGLFENALNKLDIKVYPNPSNGVFTIELPHGALMDYDMMIHDFSGKVIWKGSASTDTKMTIDLSGFPDGIYQLYMLKDGVLESTKKLIVQ